ncbi:MAG: site-specific integrase [Rudaea sp.]|nr:site-specific integrase [Rudaea sp.]
MFKHSLRTCHALQARAHAYVLGLRYAAVFEAARTAIMAKPPNVEDILAAGNRGEIKRWEMERDPMSGLVTKFTTDGSAGDNVAALEAMKIIFASPLPERAGSAVKAVTVAGIQPITLGEAARKYLATLAAPTPPKTISQKKAAVNGFISSKGEKVLMHEVTRTDISDWLASVRMSGIVTATLENKAAYVKAFFAWAQGAGHFSQGDNPASKQIQRGKNEKRRRKKFGFRVFELDQVRALFAPDALVRVNKQTRWGAIVGLYTGARVSEVGQLAVSDFRDLGGVWTLNITDEGLGQSVKNEASKRTIPVHPDLIALGLRDRVDALRAAGDKRLFPRAKAGSVNGMGNWLSKSFGRHIVDSGIVCEVGKIGYHSLRKTIIQALKDGGVREEARKEYVGHELEGDHHEVYGKLFSPAQLLNGVGTGPLQTEGIRVLSFGLDLTALRAALEAPDPPRAPRKRRVK